MDSEGNMMLDAMIGENNKLNISDTLKKDLEETVRLCDRFAVSRL